MTLGKRSESVLMFYEGVPLLGDGTPSNLEGVLMGILTRQQGVGTTFGLQLKVRLLLLLPSHSLFLAQLVAFTAVGSAPVLRQAEFLLLVLRTTNRGVTILNYIFLCFSVNRLCDLCSVQ